MADRATNILDSIEHSKKQENAGTAQVCRVFRDAGILPNAPGEHSKRQEMQDNRDAGAKNSHDVHAGTSIGWNTYHTYKSECIPLAVYARTEGIRDLYQLTPQVVSNFLEIAAGTDIKYSTFDKMCSAIEKLCGCINMHNDTPQDFHSAVQDARIEAKGILSASDWQTRSYGAPEAIIGALPEEKLQIVAELQYTCGLRVSDACYIPSTGWDGQNLTVENSKNGQSITVTPPAELASRIDKIIADEGQLSVNRNTYDYQLERACNTVGEEFHGTHGLRHNYAQDRMSELTSEGMSYQDALLTVSEEMGHHRPDITMHYLR